MEKFVLVFEQVMEELGLQKWFELYHGEGFAIVEERCQALEGFDQVEFENWKEKMYSDL